jgi:hypothetical protein
MKRIVVVALWCAALGCAKTEQPQHAASVAPPSTTAPIPAAPPKTATVQVPFGRNDEPPHLAFRITKVYAGQKPTATAPGHADGGAWQFFDALTSDGAPFTFGFVAKPLKGDVPMGFGDAVLATPNAARFVASLARGFEQKAPATASTGKPLRIQLVVLGRNQVRVPGGGYRDGGTATATKLFFSSDATEAEVFFNFDLTSSSGEFSEKDADYDKDLVAIAAKAL